MMLPMGATPFYRGTSTEASQTLTVRTRASARESGHAEDEELAIDLLRVQTVGEIPKFGVIVGANVQYLTGTAWVARYT